MTDIWELFREEEERRVQEERKLIVAEDAVWAALPQAERDRIIAEREAKWDALFSALDVEADEEDDEDAEEEDDDDE
jgi:hypothetical protein